MFIGQGLGQGHSLLVGGHGLDGAELVLSLRVAMTGGRDDELVPGLPGDGVLEDNSGAACVCCGG